jgi:putative transposase
VPNRYRHLTTLEVRFADWDLSLVHLVDEPTGAVLCRLFPLDKTANASGQRRSLEPIGDVPSAVKPAGGMPPLLVRLLEKRTASGLPPAYLVKDEEP